MRSLLGKGGTTDFLVRQRGIRRTRKSVVPLNQQPVTLRVTKEQNSATSIVAGLVKLPYKRFGSWLMPLCLEVEHDTSA